MRKTALKKAGARMMSGTDNRGFPLYLWKIFISVFVLLFCSCEQKYNYRELKFNDPNPNYYIFKFPLEEIRAAIRDNPQFTNSAHIDSSEQFMKWGDTIVSKSQNINDFCLDFKDYDTSHIFISKEGPILYYAYYLVHITKIDANKTKVEIISRYPRIVIGKQSNLGPFHRPTAERFVQPSKIEEYKILLRIGDYLGIKDSMPKLQLPKSDE